MAPVGRPTLYKPEHAELAYKFCLLRTTTLEDLAKLFDVHVDTICEWKNVYPEFSEAIENGKEIADANVAKGLYNRAAGYEYKEKRPIKVKVAKDSEKIEMVDVTVKVLPDVQAASLWLRNRQPKRWRDQQHVDNTHTFTQMPFIETESGKPVGSSLGDPVDK